MGMLRDRMEGDLKLKGFSLNTQRCYLNCAARYAAHYGRSPVVMGEREIRQFLIHLVKEEHASPATHRMFVASLKFLYVVTLRRPGEIARVPFPKVPRRLPVVLTGSEAERVIACITSIRHRTIAAVAYGASRSASRRTPSATASRRTSSSTAPTSATSRRSSATRASARPSLHARRDLGPAGRGEACAPAGAVTSARS